MYYYLLGLLIITIIIIITYYYIIIFYCYYFIYIIYIYYIIYMIIIYLLLLYVYSNTSLFCSWMIHICFQGTIYMPKICQPAHLRRQLSAWLALKAADCSRFHRNMALDEGQCPAALSQPATGLQWRLLVVGLALMRNFSVFSDFSFQTIPDFVLQQTPSDPLSLDLCRDSESHDSVEPNSWAGECRPCTAGQRSFCTSAQDSVTSEGLRNKKRL